MSFQKIIIFSLVLTWLSADCLSMSQNIKQKQGGNMALSNDPVVEFLSNQKKPYDSLSDKEVSGFSREIVKLVDTVDDFPVSPNLWVSSPKYMTKGQSTLLMAILYNGSRAWEVNPQTNAFAVLRHLESGKVRLEPFLYNSSKRKVHLKSALGAKPSKVKVGTWHPLVYKVNLSEKFSMDILDGSYTATELYYDLKSNSNHFVYSQDENYNAHNDSSFPKFTFSKETDNRLSIKIKFDSEGSNITLWKLNIIALKLNEKPIIVPIEINLTKEKESVVIDIPTTDRHWLQGSYMLYLDGGKEIKGPIEVQISP